MLNVNELEREFQGYVFVGITKSGEHISMKHISKKRPTQILWLLKRDLESFMDITRDEVEDNACM